MGGASNKTGGGSNKNGLRRLVDLRASFEAVEIAASQKGPKGERVVGPQGGA